MSSAAIDLNLLAVLHAVLTERNVARAATRLGVTPSAVSNALARLRVRLGDPLVVRQGRGIVPTPRALALAPALARALNELDAAVAPAAFDPRTCERTFSIALADSGQVAWGAGLTTALAAAMPLARLRLLGIDALVALGDLGSTEVDLHVGIAAEGPGLRSEPLHREPLVLVARRRTQRGALGRRGLATLRHVAVEMLPGRGLRDPVARAYERAGLPRAIAVTVPSFTAAAAIVAGSDLVATLPASLVAQGPLIPVRSVAPAIGVDLVLAWHTRTDHDPANLALRRIVRAVIADRPLRSSGP